MASNEHQLELLSDAYQAWVYADAATQRAPTGANVQADIRAMNVMFDRAIDCGMPVDTACIADWAACRITRWLVGA